MTEFLNQTNYLTDHEEKTGGRASSNVKKYTKPTQQKPTTDKHTKPTDDKHTKPTQQKSTIDKHPLADKPASDKFSDIPGGLIIKNKKIDAPSQLRIVEIINSIPMDKHIEWYYSEYIRQWQYNKLPRIASYSVNPKIGSGLRMQNLSTMKYKFNYNTMDMIVVVMKLYDYTTKHETNYGTLFCELTSNIKPTRRSTILDEAIHGNVAFTYYSASPSYISCDGEYRNRFSIYNSLLHAKKQYFAIWTELEEYVTRIKTRRQWSLYASYFYPKLEQELKNTEVEFAVKNEMSTLVLLVVTWFHTIYEELTGMSKMHINENFKAIFLGAELPDDLSFMRELIKKYGEAEIEMFRSKISHTTITFQGDSKYMQCGYKMIPLNIKEVQDPLRLRYKPWREYFISNRCNDLVVNSIAPGFSIIFDWFYIKNSKKGLYDNKSQYDRMKHSEYAKDILHILYEAQRGTYFATENLKMGSPNSGQLKQWISSKFKKLSEKIDDPINFSIEEIIMSEVTLAFGSEYVGRTVSDSISLLHSSKTYDALIGQPFRESGYDYFAKYMFEFCYNLLCINSKLGIIHGDFHLNNATIGALYYPDREIMANKNSIYKVVYVIDDEFQYVFPNNGYFGCVIDFSRAIINPEKAAALADKSIPSNFHLIKDEDKFKMAEINTLLNLYTQMFPNKLKQREELIVLFKNNFEAVFRLLTCIDIYMFTIRLTRILAQAEFPVYKKTIELVEKINRLAEGFIATDMNHLINDDAYAEKIIADDWPLLTIIKKCFPEYIDGHALKATGIITDTYVYANEMKYSVTKYETFPDILKYVKYVDDKGKLIEIKDVAEQRKKNRDEYEREKLHNLEMVNYIAMRHTQKMV